MQRSDKTFACVRRDDIVIIHDPDEIAFRLLKSAVQRDRLAGVLLRDNADLIFIGDEDFFRIVLRPINDHDKFVLILELRQDGIQAIANEALSIVGRGR